MTKHIKTIRALGVCEICLLGVSLVVLALALSGCITIPTVTPIPSPTARTTTEQTAEPHCTVNADNVYLRAGAGMSFEALTVTHKGDELTLLEDGEWLKVSTGSQTGYIFSQFCMEAK